MRCNCILKSVDDRSLILFDSREVRWFFVSSMSSMPTFPFTSPTLITRHFILTQARQQWQTQQAWEVTVSDVCGFCWMVGLEISWVCWESLLDLLDGDHKYVDVHSLLGIVRKFLFKWLVSFADGPRPPTSGIWCTQDLSIPIDSCAENIICVFLSCHEIDPKLACHFHLDHRSQSRIPEPSIHL